MKSEPVGAASRAASSKAGRDLPAAIGVGVVLGAVTIASLAFAKVGFVGLAVLAVSVATMELADAFRAREMVVPLLPVLLGGVAMQVSAYYLGEQGLLTAFLGTCLAVLVSRVLRADRAAVRDVTAGVFAAAYVPFLAGFAALMLAEPDGVWRIVVFILVTISSDIGGYAVGVRLGKHPLAPSVSPKKSWEGLAGSALLASVVGAVSVSAALHGHWLAGVACGLLAVLTATVGDLSESLLKRDLGIKDMGNLLPGHGGVMDRLDSMLPTAPVMYLVLSILVVPG